MASWPASIVGGMPSQALHRSKRVAKSPKTLSSRSTRRYPPAQARRFNLQPSLEIELSSRKLDFMGISASLYRSESLL
jgi:hypothetical protein